MAENSKIEWTTHTFNPWRGCTKVSPGCTNCYADTMSKRNPSTLGIWGPKGTRVVAAESAWKEPLKWDRLAKETIDRARDQCPMGLGDPANHIERPRVFCASMADVFEDWQGRMRWSNNSTVSEQDVCICRECGKWMSFASRECSPECRNERLPRPLTMQDVRARLFRLIDATPNLDWLLLTKRPENIAKMIPKRVIHDSQPIFPGAPGKLGEPVPCIVEGGIRPNVWLGVSCENQKAADERIPILLQTPTAVRFLSCEPLLGPVELIERFNDGATRNYLTGQFDGIKCKGVNGNPDFTVKTDYANLPRINWVIAGGESGHGARPCRVEWIRSIVQQCKAAGVACFVKQMGGNIITRNDMIEDAFNDGESGWPDPCVEHNIHGFREDYQGADCRIRLVDKKGGNPDEWPEDLCVREFPSCSR